VVDVDSPEDLVIAALEQLGLAAQVPMPDDPAALVSDLIVDPGEAGVALQLKRSALVTDQTVERLLSSRPAPGHSEESPVLFVVADRVTKAARQLLLSRQAGYLDLRGHLGLRSPRLIVVGDVEPLETRPERTRPLRGKVGLEVGAALLMRPERGPAVRELARELSRSASTVSQILAAFRRDRLVDDSNRVTNSRLFWEMADHWPSGGQQMAQLPPPGASSSISVPLRLGLDAVGQGEGWALAGSAGAVALGAPIAVRADQPLDFFVPDQAIVRRAQKLLGMASSYEQAGCVLRVAPVPAVCAERVEPESSFFDWPTAHPLFVALDLAQDAGRGREVLESWTPAKDWARVW
jgi:hypothetical protein